VEGRPCYGYEYAKVVSASRINLCFLRKFNRDLQTCRSVEIPAIGGFMAHERNDEIMALFAEGVEAVGFGDDAELVALCRRWLADDDGRAQVARRGRERVLAAGLTHRGLVERALKALLDVGT
jgi:spore maturation protein CgeB